MIRLEVMNIMFFDPQRRRSERAARISITLYRLAQAIKTINQEESEKHGLPPVQIQALLFIKHTRSDVASVGQFAGVIGASHVTAVKILNGLVEKGLAVKVKNPSDRRSSLLALTAKGMETADRLDGWGEQLQATVRTLTGEKLEQLEESLNELADGLQAKGYLTMAEPCEGCMHFLAHAATGDHPHYCQLIRKFLAHEATLKECPEHTSPL